MLISPAVSAGRVMASGLGVKKLSPVSESVDGKNNGVTVSPVTTNGLPDGRQTGNGSDSQENKPPRLPRWIKQEIVVLIQGKKVAENRGRRARDSNSELQNGEITVLEPKWAWISAYCKRHGVNRGPVQCRKRWSNLAGDFKKIKEWELQNEESDSFWLMRSDVRREKKLPGIFDREVYEIMDGTSGRDFPAKDSGREPEAIFDSGRTAAEEGLFSEFEQSAQEEAGRSPEKELNSESPSTRTALAMPLVIADKQFQPSYPGYLDPGITNKKQPGTNPEKGSASQPAQKRRRVPPETAEDSDIQDQLIGVLERNSTILTAQLEAQNINCELDRNQRKDHTDSLVGVLSKLANALGRIADKL